MAPVLSLQRRVSIAAAVSLLVTAAALFVALAAAAHARAAGRELSARLVPAAAAAGGLLSDYNAQQSALRDYVTSGRPAGLAVFGQSAVPIPAQQARVDTLVRWYPRMPGQLAAAEAAQQAWVAKVAVPQLAAARRGDLARARALQADSPVIRPYVLAVRGRVAALQAQITSMQARITARLTAGQRLLLAALAAVCVVVAVIVVGAMVAVQRWLVRPVTALRQAAGEVAAGHYDTPVPVGGPAELADLGRAAERMRTRLVTALAGAEQAEAKFRSLLEAAPDAVVCVAADGRIALLNAEAERLFGYRRQELTGQPVEILVPGRKCDAHPGHRAEYLANPRPRPMGAGLERVGRRRDGTTFPAEISLSAIDTGQGVLVSAAVRDVTERRRAAEVTARLASIIQSSHDAVIGKTLEQVVTSWNPGAEQLYGYTAQEMIGRHIEVLIPVLDREGEAQVLAAVARGERVEQYQTRRVRKDRTVVEVSLTMSPVTDAAGEITGVATITRDVTERQRADARFRGLLEAAPDAMVCVGDDGRIALVNGQTERLFGYRRDELVGQPVEILVPDEVRELHPGHRSRYVADPRPRPMGADRQLTGRRRDGTTFPAEVSLSAIDTEEGILVTAVVRDVTERLEIQAERERLRTQAERDQMERQLHQLNRLESLGQLAGGVAHDFNNLLGVISNYAAFAGEEVAKEAASSRWQGVHDDIGQVQLAAERAAALTRQLLAFARQEIIQPRVLDLNEVVTSIEQMLARTLGEHIDLVTDLAADLDPVQVDPGQIEQVLVNLAVNARDAMPRGGNSSSRPSTRTSTRPRPGRPAWPPAGTWPSRSATPGPASPTTSQNGCSSRSSPPSPRVREPASVSLPSTGSSPRRAGACESTPNPAWAPSSPRCCRSPTSPQPRRPLSPRSSSAATARRCWWSRTNRPCGKSPAGSWTATATTWSPRPAAARPSRPSPAAWSTSTCCSPTSSCRTCKAANSPGRSGSSGPECGWCSCPATPRACSASRASWNAASTSSRNPSPKPPSSPGSAKSLPPLTPSRWAPGRNGRRGARRRGTTRRAAASGGPDGCGGPHGPGRLRRRGRACP